MSLRPAELSGEEVRRLAREWDNKGHAAKAGEISPRTRSRGSFEMEPAEAELYRQFAEDVRELVEGMREAGMDSFADYFLEAQEIIVTAWTNMRMLSETHDLASDASVWEVQSAPATGQTTVQSAQDTVQANQEAFSVGGHELRKNVADFARAESSTPSDEQ